MNSNTLKVLMLLTDEDKNLGFTAMRGNIKENLQISTELSKSTIDRSLKLLIECGYVAEGINRSYRKNEILGDKYRGYKKTYYITPAGIDFLSEIQ